MCLTWQHWPFSSIGEYFIIGLPLDLVPSVPLQGRVAIHVTRLQSSSNSGNLLALRPAEPPRNSLGRTYIWRCK